MATHLSSALKATFYQLPIIFQGSCKYLLARDCGLDHGVYDNSNSNSSFSIRITNDARDSFGFSWLRDELWTVAL